MLWVLEKRSSFLTAQSVLPTSSSPLFKTRVFVTAAAHSHISRIHSAACTTAPVHRRVVCVRVVCAHSSQSHLCWNENMLVCWRRVNTYMFKFYIRLAGSYYTNVTISFCPKYLISVPSNEWTIIIIIISDVGRLRNISPISPVSWVGKTLNPPQTHGINQVMHPSCWWT